jgi:hypothetical protein
MDGILPITLNAVPSCVKHNTGKNNKLNKMKNRCIFSSFRFTEYSMIYSLSSVNEGSIAGGSIAGEV